MVKLLIVFAALIGMTACSNSTTENKDSVKDSIEVVNDTTTTDTTTVDSTVNNI